MWPTKDQPNFGVFVKRVVGQLNNRGVVVTRVVSIKGRGHGLTKIYKHTVFSISAIFYVLFDRSEIVYVHAPNYLFGIVFCFAKFVGKKVVVNFHGNDLLPSSSLQSYVYHVNKFFYRHVDSIVVPSNYFKKEIKKKLPEFKRSIFISASGGVDFNLFKPKTVNDHVVRVAYVGRVDKGKGWDDYCFLCESCQGVGNVLFYVIGSGIDFDLMKNRLSSFDNVKFLGMLSQEILASTLGIIDIVVFPSKLPESLGLSAIEALASGCKVVAYDNAAIPEYVSNTNGYLVKFGDKESLSDSLKSAIKGLKSEVGIPYNIRATVSEYDSNKVADRLAFHLQEVANEKN